MSRLRRRGTHTGVLAFTGNSAGPVALGDAVGDAAALYGFNLMNSGYTGDCLKVERSSDGTMLDVGFNDNGTFDAAAFNTFVGVDTARLHTWFDQSGNTYDLVQTVDADQPIINQDAQDFWRVTCQGGDFVQEVTFMGATTNSVVHVLWQHPIDGTSFGAAAGGIDFAPSLDFYSPWWTVTQGPTTRTQAAGSTEGRSRAMWDDGKPRQHVVKFLADVETHYEFGAQSLDSWASDNPDYTRLTMGKNDFGNANTAFYDLPIFDADVSAATLWSTTKTNYAAMFSYDDIYLAVGDSLTTTTFQGLGDTWTRDVIDTLSIPNFFIQSQGGWRIQDWIDDKAYLEWYAENLSVSNGKIAIIWAGTNDLVLDVISGAACLTRMKSLASSLRTAGFDRIIAMTIMDRTVDAAFDTARGDFNTDLLADTSGDFDVIADTTVNPNLEDATDVIYFNGDEVHLTDAGHLEVSAVIQTAIASVIPVSYLDMAEVSSNEFAIELESVSADHVGNSYTMLGAAEKIRASWPLSKGASTTGGTYRMEVWSMTVHTSEPVTQLGVSAAVNFADLPSADPFPTNSTSLEVTGLDLNTGDLIWVGLVHLTGSTTDLAAVWTELSGPYAGRLWRRDTGGSGWYSSATADVSGLIERG